MTYEMKGPLLYTDTGIAQAYDPIISNHLNNEVPFLRYIKSNPAKSINYRFVATVGRNDMVGPKASLDDLVGSSSSRINLTSTLRQYAAAISIEDARVLEAKKNGIGPLADAWSEEFMNTLNDLAVDLDTAMLASGTTLGSGFGDAVDGLGAILQSTGSIYGQARATYSGLVANVDTSVGDLSVTDLRTYLTTLRGNGAKLENLVIFTTPTVETYLRNKMENNKMYMGVSSRAGFEGLLTFDGVPIYTDSLLPSGYMYILDMPKYELAVFQPFTIGADLAKTNLTTTKYIWGILNLVCRQMNTSYKLGGITS